MLKNISIIASLSLLLFFLMGCAPKQVTVMKMGKPILPEKVEMIEKGVTTKAQVTELFGPAMNTSLSMDGTKEIWTYQYQEAVGVGQQSLRQSSAAVASHFQALNVWFEGDVVFNFSYQQ